MVLSPIFMRVFDFQPWAKSMAGIKAASNNNDFNLFITNYFVSLLTDNL